MIVRIVIAVFISLVTGVCYLAGLSRLISGLLIGFGVLASLFFGILFVLPPGSERVSFSVTASGSSWPFFLLALALVLMIVYLFSSRARTEILDADGGYEPLQRRHLQFFGGAVVLYLFSLFLPAVLLFPSDDAGGGSREHAAIMALLGAAVFVVGVSLALYLFYRSSRGGTGDNPVLMKTAVPALFTVFHLDKIPALAAYLLVYSTNPELVFPEIAALALAAYIPVALFLIKTVPSDGTRR